MPTRIWVSTRRKASSVFHQGNQCLVRISSHSLHQKGKHLDGVILTVSQLGQVHQSDTIDYLLQDLSSQARPYLSDDLESTLITQLKQDVRTLDNILQRTGHPGATEFIEMVREIDSFAVGCEGHCGGER